MLSVKRVFQTSDGDTFGDHDEAMKHEEKQFQNWLRTNPKVSISDLMDRADVEPDEWRCSERDLVRYVAHLAYIEENERKDMIREEPLPHCPNLGE